jgi:hypothetical protein
MTQRTDDQARLWTHAHTGLHVRLAAHRRSGVLLAAMCVAGIAAPALAQIAPMGTMGNAGTFDAWPFPGDANRDTRIDQADLDKVTADLGMTGMRTLPRQGRGRVVGMTTARLWSDVNGDGVVDAADRQIVEDAIVAGSVVTPDGFTIAIGGGGLLDLTATPYGVAYVWPDGPWDWENWDGTYEDQRPLEYVLLTHLGDYDPETGAWLGDGGGLLDGKYAGTYLQSIDETSGFEPFRSWANVPDLVVSDQRYVFDPDCDDDPGSGGTLCDPGIDQRTSAAYSSVTHLYAHNEAYRRDWSNDAFILGLNLPTEIEQNLLNRQFRPDYDPFFTEDPPLLERPTLWLWEGTEADFGYISLYPVVNKMRSKFRTRGPVEPFSSLPTASIAFAREAFVGDYDGLMAFWVLGDNTGWPSESGYGQGSFWQSNVLPPLNDGLSGWSAYRMSGNTEVYKPFYYMLREWADHQGVEACGGTNYACDKGSSVRNVMMFKETQTDRNGVFPFVRPNDTYTFNFIDGPIGSDLSAMYIAAIFYDISVEAGLGDDKADQLIWKTISIIDDRLYLPMRMFGRKVQDAARQLWPDANNPGQSIYEQDIHDVLISRGIAVDAPLPGEPGEVAIGSADFNLSLPPSIGPTVLGFPVETANPTFQPSVNSYGALNWFADEYTASASPVDYVAYTFYKHSKFGPCDFTEFQLPDDLDWDPVNCPECRPNGTVLFRLEDREFGNITVFLPT